MRNYFDVMKLAVESALPNNTVLLDDVGLPSVMVRIPKFTIKDVIPDATSADVFPAFKVGDEEVDEIFISKYPNIVVGDRAYSLPGRDPKANITFDQAVECCKKKGTGWHLMSNAEYMALAYWCKKNGTIPRGNTSFGCSSDATYEHGTVSYTYMDSDVKRNGRTLTGSGPATWSHDHTPAGIYDLCGNVWEWASGLRLKDGEIQVIPNNDAAKNSNMTAGSGEWKAILAKDGSLVTPGTAGTLHYDNDAAGDETETNHDIGGAVKLSDKVEHPMYTGDASENPYYAYQYQTFESTTAIETVTPPEIAKVLGLYPTGVSDHNGDGFWCRNYGERLPLRGGNWDDVGRAGVFALTLNNPRLYSRHDVGFRAAFVNL